MKMTQEACAKLNLTLEITGRRSDGYHDIASVMTGAALRDCVTLESGSGAGIRVLCEDPDVPAGEGNICYRAAEVFFRKTGAVCDGLCITLDKHIPMQAGLGGGSSDAAAVLRGLRQIYRPEMMIKELECMAVEVGSDVPYCVRGVTSLVRGRGEALLRLPKLPLCWFVIVKPRESCDTAAMYARYDAQQPAHRCDTGGLTKALEYQDLREISDRLCNVFERLLPADSQVPRIKEQLMALGARGAAMTGSGSAVYGLFTDETAACAAALALQGAYPFAVCAQRT